MTKQTDPSNRLDPLICEALAWVTRLKSGEATLEDAERLVAWRTKSPEHERAFRDAVKCWKAIGRGLVGEHPTRRVRQRKTRSTSLS